MDINIGCESFLNLCHGCLSAERNTQLVTGVFSDIYFKLLNDDENQIQSVSKNLLQVFLRILCIWIVLEGNKLNVSNFSNLFWLLKFCRNLAPSSLAVPINKKMLLKVMDHAQILLCWECVAILEKLKTFQDRIRKAQLILLDHLKAYSIKSEKIRPSCLSSLTRILNKTFTKVIYKEENLNKEEQSYFNKTNNLNKTQNLTKEKVKHRNLKRDIDKHEINFNEENDKSSNINTEYDSLEEKNYVVLELKLECNDKIKEEENEPDNENMDYNDEYKDDDLRVDIPIDYGEMECKVKEEDYLISKRKVKKSLHKFESIKYVNRRREYAKFATITRNQNVSTENYKDICETVRLSQNEYENDVLKKERDRLGTRLQHKCEKCKDNFFRNIDLLRHVSFYHNELGYPQKCAICKSTVQSSEKLSQHWTRAHTVMFKCTLCLELYRSVAEMKRHIRNMHIKTYTCNECACVFSSFSEFKKHYKSHESFICGHCGTIFGKKKSLITHIKLLHTPVLCRICNQTYTNQKRFKHHNKMYHPEIVKVDTTEERSYCVECDKQYSSVLKYRQHLQHSARHTQRKKPSAQCPECGKIFTRTNFMKNHYRFVHLKKTKNYCDKCKKYFTTGYGLRRHIERVHKKIARPKTKVCDLCGRAFGTNNILENHRRTHTGEKPFKCVYCPASFAQQTALKSHQKTQHKPDKLISSLT